MNTLGFWMIVLATAFMVLALIGFAPIPNQFNWGLTLFVASHLFGGVTFRSPRV